MTLDIVKTLKAMESAARIPLKDWVLIVPMVHLKVPLFNQIFGRKPCSIFSALVAPGKDE